MFPVLSQHLRFIGGGGQGDFSYGEFGVLSCVMAHGSLLYVFLSKLRDNLLSLDEFVEFSVIICYIAFVKGYEVKSLLASG